MNELETYPAGVYLFTITRDDDPCYTEMVSYPREFTDRDVLVDLLGMLDEECITQYNLYGDAYTECEDADGMALRVDGYKQVKEEHLPILRQYLSFTHL